MNFAALLALAFLLIVASVATELQGYFLPLEMPEHTMTLMSIAIMLIGGWLVGVIFHSIHLPRICGYLVYGIIIGPSGYTLGLLPSAEHVREDLGFINHVAISLIALTAGGEIRFEWLRGQLKRIATLVGVEVCIILGASFLLFFFGLPYLSFIAGSSTKVFLSASIIASIIVIANSPSVAIAMIADYRAKGPLSQMTLSVTIAKDMILIALFTTAVVVVKTLLDSSASFSPEFIVAIVVQLLGSIALGAFAGILMALYVGRVKAHMGIFIIGCCLLFALVGKEELAIGEAHFHLEPLLIALSAGVLMQNFYPQKTHSLFHKVEELSIPVYCLFFTLAGAKVELELLKNLWYFAAGLAVLRAGIIWCATRIGIFAAGIKGEWSKLLWFGLIPQAGVSLVLVTIVAESFGEHSWTVPLTNLLIGMIVCNELFGPIGFRYALLKAGEVESVTKVE